MAGMKIISMLDHEVVKARQVAQRDLEEMQRRVLQVTTALADSLVALADRVTDLEEAVAGVGDRVKQVEQAGDRR
jgi:hypothetical protein